MKPPTLELGKVAQVNPRRQIPAHLDDDTTVSFVPMAAVSEQTAAIEEQVHRSLAEVRRGFTQFVDGDVIMAKITPCMENGKIAHALSLSNGIGFGSTEFHVVRAGPAIEARFIYYLLRQKHIRDAASRQMRGGVGQQRVPADFLTNLRCPIPALSEQRRIVEILDQADALRRQRAETDAKVARILPALFHKLFGDPSVNPFEWDSGTVDDVILETQYGTSTRASENGAGIPVLRMNNIDVNGNLDLTNLKYVELDESDRQKYSLGSGDILFNRTNSRELVGKTGLWRAEFDAVPASYLIRVRIDPSKIVPEFLWAHMNSPYIKSLLFEKSRRAIGMANINARELRALPILIPPLEIQERFVKHLSTLQNIVRHGDDSRTKIDRMFDVLLHRAFTGELTAGWRKRNLATLEAELAEQLKALEQPKASRAARRKKGVTSR